MPDRRWYLWPGLSALVVAYILLIVDSGFSFVEAYTLPLGVAALGVGGYLVRRDQQTPTWLVLGPGLAIALLPSVPQALADPTGLRALLLGVAALAVLVAGVRLHWQAPFVSGVVILTALLLFNIGPYANAAPRVVLIAIGSAILLGIGITWEDRVRDGRKVVRYVRSMR
ncbi:SCO7613 C-terminal domain-containing membrane protein [Aeromicrobium sp. UC242_57]|uniref:SCO7613 C-terminal domain-containing membrane protein n=1 Tax=Aeromicrobium sp. UC242_57 TaxID=3374624 RepID=UPI0037B7BABD